jgi:prevent-host-death family protein
MKFGEEGGDGVVERTRLLEVGEVPTFFEDPQARARYPRRQLLAVMGGDRPVVTPGHDQCRGRDLGQPLGQPPDRRGPRVAWVGLVSHEPESHEMRGRCPSIVCWPPVVGASHIYYDCRMPEIASRELRNNTRALLDRVEAGESVTITVDGRPVAILEPISRRPRWLARDEFVRRVQPHQADAALADELRALAPDTTDDLRSL